MTNRAFILGALALVGCYWTSPKPIDAVRDAPTVGAVRMVQLTGGQRVSGELIAVQDKSAVLIASGRLVVIQSTSAVTFGELSPHDARFPFGLTLEAQAAILRSLGQSAPDTIRSTTPPRDEEQFFSDARAGTRKYQSQQAAVDDGFRRVGIEFPAMGEHWVNVGRVMDNQFDASRPSILTYINTASGPRLAGVAYTRRLRPNETMPAFPSQLAWHDHNGEVSDESLPMHHAAGATTPKDSNRLVVLHAWIWVPNPEGNWLTDNWSLPLVRHSFASRAPTHRLSPRVVALGDNPDYYALVLRTSLDLTRSEDSVVAVVLAEHGQHARRLDVATAVSDSTVMITQWNALWRDLERALPARAVGLAHLRAQM